MPHHVPPQILARSTPFCLHLPVQLRHSTMAGGSSSPSSFPSSLPRRLTGLTATVVLATLAAACSLIILLALMRQAYLGEEQQTRAREVPLGASGGVRVAAPSSLQGGGAGVSWVGERGVASGNPNCISNSTWNRAEGVIARLPEAPPAGTICGKSGPCWSGPILPGCRQGLIGGYALDLAYESGECEPSDHPMPKFKASDFLKPCSLNGGGAAGGGTGRRRQQGQRLKIFFIIAHRQPKLLARLVGRLRAPGHVILIHVVSVMGL